MSLFKYCLQELIPSEMFCWDNGNAVGGKKPFSVAQTADLQVHKCLRQPRAATMHVVGATDITETIL